MQLVKLTCEDVLLTLRMAPLTKLAAQRFKIDVPDFLRQTHIECTKLRLDVSFDRHIECTKLCLDVRFDRHIGCTTLRLDVTEKRVHNVTDTTDATDT